MNLISNPADTRNSARCALVFFAAVVLVWPVAEMPFNDDWSYAFVVKRLMETGHIHYNGWGSPILLTQAYWGWLWVKLLGYSFNVLRLSMLPAAAGSVAICYLLARRAGLVVWTAVFVAMLFALSPLFLPLATSFMNDVPGCFCMLLSLLALTRCVQSPSVSRSGGWLLLGAIAGVIGGLSRQSAWIAPLALLPMIAWLRRSDRPLLLAAMLAWMLCLSTAIVAQRWFDQQPFALPEPSFSTQWLELRRDPVTVGIRFIEILFTLILLILPAAIVALGWLRTRSLVALAVVVLLLLGRFLYAHPRLFVAPWMDNTITSVGILGNAQLHGERPVVLPWPILPVLSGLVFIGGAAIVSSVLGSIPNWKSTIVTSPSPPEMALLSIGLVGGGYLLLLLSRSAQNLSFDRHLLPLIPLSAILLLRHARVGVISWLLLAIYGLYAVGSTQEDIALARARGAAVIELQDAGVARTQIDGGLEFNFWTQLLSSGYINDSRIKIPAGIFQPHVGRTPSVQARYRLEYQLDRDSEPSEFGSVSYFSYLPPFQRRIWIDRVVGGQGR